MIGKRLIQDVACEEFEMKKLPHLEVSKGAAKRAGRLLATDIVYSEIDGVPEDILEAFKIAHAWRVSHSYPMRIEQLRLAHRAKKFGGAVTASRLKRMASIRKKLKGTTISLDQMQDLGGCRVILPNIQSVREFQAEFEEANAERIKWSKDYISEPKASGYRSSHLIIKPALKGDREAHNKQTLEIQLRTHLQHVWATTQEAIGYMRGENLKGGEGCPKWLRLLELMGAQLAMAEGQPIGPHVPQSTQELVLEISALEADLSAIETLAGFNLAADYQQNANWQKAEHFLVHLDTVRGTVSVRPQRSFGAADFDNFGDSSEKVQTLLVSVDSVESLASAYPNFFLDVSEFLTHLKRATGNEEKRPMSSESAIDKINVDWLKGYGRG